MRYFILITFLVLSTTNAMAQARIGAPGAPPAAIPTPSVSVDKTPGLTRIIGVCIRPGDMLTIEGKNLDLLEDNVPALDILGKALPLKILNKTRERFVTKLPQDGIEADQTYKIILADKSNLNDFETTTLKVRICPSSAIAPQTADTQEILIFADRKSRGAILSELERRNIEIIRRHTLSTLESILIVINGDGDLINDLSAIFPEAEIDANTDLSAAKGPRLYAKEKIKWPDKGACVDKALKIPIGLIDGGIDRAHPAFAGQSISEKTFLNDVEADQNHATAIASILIGNAPEQGLDGLLTGAKLYNAVALRRAPDDQQLASIEATLRGLDWLMSKDIRLINVSLAGKKNRVLVKSFEKSLERGALIFAAAGNNGPNAKPVYPAAIDGVFAVTAIDAAGRTYKAANRGGYIDFSAPGVDIWAATPGGSGAYKSGTSYATLYALAASALQLTKMPNISKDLLIKLLSRDIIAQCP